jgi:hypothetical protein
VAGVGDGELVDGRGPDGLDHVAEPVVQRSVADPGAQLAVVFAVQGGQPDPVPAFVVRGEHGLALGYPQRVGRDPGMEPQPRIVGPGRIDEEVTDRTDQVRSARGIMGPNGPAFELLQRIGHHDRGGVAQREQDVPLLLADAAAEHRELDRRLVAREVPLGLPAAEQRPSQRAVQLPPALGFLIRRDAAAGRVARHQVGAGAEPADGARRAEPPGLGAQPAQVLPGITAMSEFPVEHAVQPVRADHEVAGPEIAVHQRVRGGSGPVRGEPAQADLERGPGLGEAFIQPGYLTKRVDPRQPWNRTGIHPVDLGQDLPEAAREAGPRGGVCLVPQQPPWDRLPVEVLHQQIGMAERVLPVVVDLGHGDAGQPRRGHRRRLDGHVLVRVPGPAVRLAEQDEAALHTLHLYPDVPALPARTAGQRPDASDLDLRPPQRPQPRGQDADQPGRLRHGSPADTLALPPAVSCDTRSTAQALVVKVVM